MTKDFSSIVSAVLEFQKELNDSQRHEFWLLIQEGYCERCGAKLQKLHGMNYCDCDASSIEAY